MQVNECYDGLSAPDGQKIDRRDGSEPILVWKDKKDVKNSDIYLTTMGKKYATENGVWCVKMTSVVPRPLLSFADALQAHKNGKNIRCKDKDLFFWRYDQSVPDDGLQSWMLEYKEFYVTTQEYRNSTKKDDY